MALTTDGLRDLARLAGFEWTDTEVEAIRPLAERALEALDRLDRLPLEGVEPALQYRIG